MIKHKIREFSGAFSALLAAVVVAVVMVGPVGAGPVLDAVKARDLLYCGVGEAMPGFSERDATGTVARVRRRFLSCRSRCGAGR